MEHYFGKVPRFHLTDTICTTDSTDGMILTGGQQKVLGGKPVSVPFFSTRNLTWTDLVSNLGLRGRPATIHLSHDTGVLKTKVNLNYI